MKIKTLFVTIKFLFYFFIFNIFRSITWIKTFSKHKESFILQIDIDKKIIEKIVNNFFDNNNTKCINVFYYANYYHHLFLVSNMHAVLIKIQ